MKSKYIVSFLTPILSAQKQKRQEVIIKCLPTFPDIVNILKIKGLIFDYTYIFNEKRNKNEFIKIYLAYTPKGEGLICPCDSFSKYRPFMTFNNRTLKSLNTDFPLYLILTRFGQVITSTQAVETQTCGDLIFIFL